MERIGRRQFLERGVWFGLGVAFPTVWLTSCGEKTQPPTSTNNQDQEKLWKQMLPGDRLRKLERKEFPQLSNFSLVTELNSAAAELRCQITTCNRSVAEMQQAVEVLSHTDFTKAYERVHGVQLPTDLTQGFTVEFVEGKPLKKVNIDRDMMKIAYQAAIPPEIRETLKRYNIDSEIALLKEIIIHAHSHLNQSTEKFVLEKPVELQFPDSNQKIVVTGIDSLFIEINDPKNRFLSISGLSETLSQLTTQFICAQAGAYISIAPYRYGEDLLNSLLKIGKVNTTDVLQVYHGQKSITDLLDKIGSTFQGKNVLEETISSRELGVKVLTIIGLVVDGVVPFKIAQKWIEQNYGQKIY